MKHLLLVIFLSAFFTSYGQGSLESDRLALIALYNSSNGPQWIQKAGWNPAGNPGDSPCGWWGVTCEGGRVTGLNLQGSALDGSIPPEIGNLDQLKTFIVDWTMIVDNQFPGNTQYLPLPTEIGNLTNLEYLDLSGKVSDWPWVGGFPLQGPLPSSLGNLTKLTYLDLSCSLVDLQYHGSVDGAIPSTLGNLVNLKHLDLGYQQFSGPIPPELGNLTQLEYLNLTGANTFTGGIPASFNNLVNLKTLGLGYFNCCTIYNGTLGGPIPDLSGIPVSAIVNIESNAFNFDGLDLNISRIDWYGRQSPIKLDVSMLGLTLLTAQAGGIIANNTYKWFKDNVLIATITGDNTYLASENGIYYATVTSSAVPGLVLTTEKEVVIVLPVTLVSFSASSEGDQNNLTWKTSFESNSKGFEVERSWNGSHFEKVGFVAGHGDSNNGSDYSFIDKSPLFNSYYRLKQLDFDGTFAYSSIVSVKNAGSAIVAYPNPAADHFYLKNLKGNGEVVIRTLEGKTISRQVVEPGKPVITTGIAPGLYTVTAEGSVQKIAIL
ncbi:Por secretion system C-terminal sorting domain-containing protein [Dyadobacter sp. SG02]|uniref:T9SS type A sorting domain-containing protein n=1 Tax=Dyadobacter sp. SG02 TaxID=1855291 RepID=UPI0008C57BF6|nr:T9SS type A sorting domain-containing protein [Dyadobacter sp. SG02]SEI55421.1 Por secretion system C-terminal sorting domain-containing protein [Dyadobacter sp. SG02]